MTPELKQGLQAMEECIYMYMYQVEGQGPSTEGQKGIIINVSQHILRAFKLYNTLEIHVNFAGHATS